MKSFDTFIETFFFRRISASGWGLLRVTWGLTALGAMLARWPDIQRYYSDAGLLPVSLMGAVIREDWRFNILDTVSSPEGVSLLYAVLLASLAFTALGIRPRLSMLVSCVLLFSFHERNVIPLTGGDTTLRNVGFLLLVSPQLRAFSLERVPAQWAEWRRSGRLLPGMTMSVWPYRLLLWQMIVIYLASVIDKLRGAMWLGGTVVASVTHHPHFMKYPAWFMDLLVPLSPALTWGTIGYEMLWILLLVPAAAKRFLPERVARISLKRWLLLGGMGLHLGILALMNVGSFSYAMLAAYPGLLLDDDFAVFRRWLNRKWKGHIAMLYDGECRLCRRTAFTMTLLDHLGRLRTVDFHDAKARKEVAPELKFGDLDKSLHMKFPQRTLTGFEAFRALSWNIPALCLFAPLLYLPGVPVLGRRVYRWTAERRKGCNHENCAL